MHNRWLGSISDPLTDVVLDEIEDPLERAELQDLHQRLKLLDQTIHIREQELAAKGIQRGQSADLFVRFNLLVEMFIGANSPERMRYEIQWLTALQEATETGYNEFLQRQRAQVLHTPQGQKIVLPGGTDDGPVPPTEA